VLVRRGQCAHPGNGLMRAVDVGIGVRCLFDQELLECRGGEWRWSDPVRCGGGYRINPPWSCRNLRQSYLKFREHGLNRRTRVLVDTSRFRAGPNQPGQGSHAPRRVMERRVGRRQIGSEIPGRLGQRGFGAR